MVKNTFLQCSKCYYDYRGRVITGHKDGHGIAFRYLKGRCKCEECHLAYQKQQTIMRERTKTRYAFFNRIEARLEDKLQQRYRELA